MGAAFEQKDSTFRAEKNKIGLINGVVVNIVKMFF